MKRLAVLRHAKSSWDDARLADFDRPLNDRGRRAASRMGEEIARRKMRFDLTLCSTAARARETLSKVEAGLGTQLDPHFDERIYMASSATLMDIVREIPDRIQTALLVGHNPGLEQLVAVIARDDPDGLRWRVQEKFPTCALAVVAVTADSWSEVTEESGQLIELILSRELD